MATFLPFRALRYSPTHRKRLGDVIAPPYDVISDGLRRRLAARDPHNIVHLDLPVAEGDASAPEASARRLAAWTAAGVLQRDERPAYYLCEQSYLDGEGATRVRRGLFGRLRLETFESGIVIPHERTLEAPRRDREALLEATRAHLSPVFLLHPDPDGRVAGTLERHSEAVMFDSARDDDDVRVRLARLDDRDVVERLQADLRPHWTLIADGHHRYESSLAYRDRRRRDGRQDAEHTLAFLCSLEDAGLTVFPIHRLVHSLSGFDPSAFRSRLGELFRLNSFDGPEALLQALRSRRGRPGVFGLNLQDEPHCWLAEWIDGAGMDRPGFGELAPSLRRLDVILLHRLVLEAVLDITPEAQARQAHLRYVKDESALFESVADGAAQIGILLNPTPIEQVVEVTRQKLRLPQKTTYFYPKVPSGLVLDTLDD
ncbi:MAG TPA: DUF1015 domain-containing protein [Candidatus Polarisedimenticolia bacterium]|nr:DUF1015 domain-containing protein [Candidatus Polarisedimenticolia bacterium]